MQNSSCQFWRQIPSVKPVYTAFVASLITSALAFFGVSGKEGSAATIANDGLPAATSKFAFKLYNQVKDPSAGKNTFLSPTSIMMALAMTYNGADGKTRQAMAQTLELQGLSLDEVNRVFADLKSTLDASDPKVQLQIANSLWAREGLTLKPTFVKRNKDYYEALTTSLDFSSLHAADTINSWVSKNTGGKIEKIVDIIPPETVLYLINAIYFKGQWQFEFNKGATKPDVFKLPGGAQKEVPMMSQARDFPYFKGQDFQAVALPYGSGRISMYIVLPDDPEGLKKFQEKLTAENWATWMNSFRATPGDLKLPRFQIEWESSLVDALTNLGMAEAFDPARANFSEMADLASGVRPYISEVKHKAWAEVNEEGTEAAAATSVGVALTSIHIPPKPFSMKVDHPFFFVIQDNRTGVVLFMGSVANPS